MPDSRDATLLQTKLAIPTVAGVVARPRLFERLDAGREGRLTVVTAPAGFGKTTLVREWLALRALKTAWVSLDRDDRALPQFLSYVAAAVDRVLPDLALPAPGQAVLDAFVTLMLNAMARAPERFVLVLDDIHLAASVDVLAVLDRIIEHLPPTCHLVLLSRETLPLRLARHALRADLLQLETDDLRFSPDEAMDYLNAVLEDPVDAQTLVSRSEGWIVGLQAATLSARHGNRDTVSLSDPLVYLEQEVFATQPDPIRAALLATAVVDEMTPPVCAALCSDVDLPGPVLHLIEARRLFLVSLGGDRYRYHQLFREMLLGRLRTFEPGRWSVLHQRASHAFTATGQWVKAAQHAVQANDGALAAACLERAWDRMCDDAPGRWRAWVAEVPEAVVIAHPVLAAQRAFADLALGRLAEASAHLDQDLSTGGKVPNPALFDVLDADLAIGRAYLAQARNNPGSALAHTRPLLDGVLRTTPLQAMRARSLSALASWGCGDLRGARGPIARNLQDMLASDQVFDALGLAFLLADASVRLGELTEAQQVCSRVLGVLDDRGTPQAPGVEEIYRMLAEIDLCRGEGDKAEANLSKAEACGAVSLTLGWRHRALATRAWLQASSGDTQAALDSLEAAERAFTPTPIPEHRPLRAARARVLFMAGRKTEAGWLTKAFHDTRDAYEALTCVRDRMWSGASREGLALLTPLRASAAAAGRIPELIEIDLLEALLRHRCGERTEARAALLGAMAHAAKEGHVQVFLDEGRQVADLLSAFPDLPLPLGAPVVQVVRDRLARNPAFEALTKREGEVLELLAQGLSNEQIGRRLFVALDTVKGHNRGIFRKLGVRRRTAAVAKGRALGLVT